MIDEEQHVLRYWEKEFPVLKPRKNRAGNRVYSEKDMKIIRQIKKMIREDKLSLKGAKEQLEKYLKKTVELPDLFASADIEDNSAQPTQAKPVKIVSKKSPKPELDEIVALLKEIRSQLEAIWIFDWNKN